MKFIDILDLLTEEEIEKFEWNIGALGRHQEPQMEYLYAEKYIDYPDHHTKNEEPKSKRVVIIDL